MRKSRRKRRESGQIKIYEEKGKGKVGVDDEKAKKEEKGGRLMF